MTERPEGKGWRIATHEDGSRRCVPAVGGAPSDSAAWEVRFRGSCAVCLKPIGETPFYKLAKDKRTDHFGPIRGPQFFHAWCKGEKAE